MRRRVYLAGPVENTDDPHSWRDELKDEFEIYEFIDPTDYFEPPIHNPHGLFLWCLKHVQYSDFVLVNYESGVESWGTPAELMWAWMQGVPVLTWSIEETEEMPNFLIALSDIIHDDVGELMDKGWEYKLY